YLSTLSAIMQLTAEWAADEKLKSALTTLPQLLSEAWNKDWQQVVDGLQGVRNLFVIGRGIGFGAAQEAALKLKETCGLHAEAFSAAEVKHGPMAIVDEDFPVLLFAQQDNSMESLDALINDFRVRKARVF